MAQFNECIHEWHALVGDLKLYIAQEFPECSPVFENRPAKTSAPIAKQETPKPKHDIPVPVATKPTTTAPAPIIAKKAPQPAAPKPKESKLPAATTEPIMQALCRPFIKPTFQSLEDCLERFRKVGIHTIDAPIPDEQNSQHQFVVVSFFAPKSEEEQFIQKVVSSVSERLIPCVFYAQAGLSAAAECFTLAAAGYAKAVILMYAQEDAQKVSSWLVYFGDDLQNDEKQQTLLTSKRKLFESGFYELVFTPNIMQDATMKRALWNDLQKLI